MNALVAALTWTFARQRVAAALMGLGCSAAVMGSYVMWGQGVALLVAAGLLIPLSILVGWE